MSIAHAQKMPMIHSIWTFSNRAVGNRMLHFIRLGLSLSLRSGEESRDLDEAETSQSGPTGQDVCAGQESPWLLAFQVTLLQ